MLFFIIILVYLNMSLSAYSFLFFSMTYNLLTIVIYLDAQIVSDWAVGTYSSFGELPFFLAKRIQDQLIAFLHYW
jgi:hypothetical protein